MSDCSSPGIETEGGVRVCCCVVVVFFPSKVEMTEFINHQLPSWKIPGQLDMLLKLD